MDCSFIIEELHRYLKNDSPFQEEIATHLQDCFACQEEKLFQARFIQLCSQLPQIEPSEQFYQKIASISAARSSHQRTSLLPSKRKATFVQFLNNQLNERPEWYFSVFAHAALIFVLAFIYIRETRNTSYPQELLLRRAALEIPKSPNPQPPKLSSEVLKSGPLPLSLDNLIQPELAQKMPWLSTRQTLTERRKKVLPFKGSAIVRENILKEGLNYLKYQQDSDGGFNTRTSGAREDYRIGISALALLPFLAEGNTHVSGPYQEVVHQGIFFLLNQQQVQGDEKGFIGPLSQKYIYNHALATYALLENYYLTSQLSQHNPVYENALKSAFEYLIYSQNSDGGWGYKRGSRVSDISISGWPIMVLHLALHAPHLISGERVQQSLERSKHFLQSLQFEEWKITYRHLKDRVNGPYGLTACGMFCAQLLGDVFSPQTLELQSQQLFGSPLLSQPPHPSIAHNLYFWYYGTLALSRWPQKTDEQWLSWNKDLLQVIHSCQVREGLDFGAITPEDAHLTSGGKVYSTALALLSLQIYYRY